MTAPGSSVMRKMSAGALSWRSGRSAVGVCRRSGGVPGRWRDGRDARQSKIGPQQPRRHDAVMRCNDQTIELVVGVVGEREHHPELSAFAGAHFDAANDAVGAGCGGNLDAVGVAALMIEHRGEV